jgi:CRISPR-associated protein Csm2
MSSDPKQDARKIITQGDVEELVNTAKTVGGSLARQLTTSQIRNIFGEVRRIEMDWPPTKQDADDAFRRVVLLQPKLAYQAKRERGRGVEELQQVLDPCIEEIRKAPKEQRRVYFQRFVDFFEAILAYHKAAGGN